MNLLTMPLTEIKGVGEKRARDFENIGIKSVYDLLRYFPVRYEDRGQISFAENLTVGESVCLKVRIISPVKVMRIRKNLLITKARCCDDTGELNLCWYNIKYMDRLLKQDNVYTVFGQIQRGKSGLEMINPVVEKEEDFGKFTGKIVPVYPRTKGISQKIFVKTAEEALNKAEGLMFSVLPESVEKEYSLMNELEAVKNIHFPENEEKLITARERFAFENFFLFKTAVEMLRKKEGEKGILFPDTDTDEFETMLPFRLTNAQRKVIDEVKKDLKSGKASKRLIQGDVGSGKTAVAMAMCYIAYKNGYQSCVMAPTEILARQHYENFKTILKGINIRCLTSSTSKKEREQITRELEEGKIHILTGTHALIEDKIIFNKLGYVICDEQHRFGVEQRMRLIEKGDNPHLAVMTATPIPRTLSLLLYGDLTPGIINELPPGRNKIKTVLLNESMREKAYKFTLGEIKKGGQAYVVCPLVEENDEIPVKSASEFKNELETMFPEIKIGLLHGKMKDREKNGVMEEFKKGVIKILVSTTVVEVGVDVKNANVMIIENAERFGLSQLHQLRGRVGRGTRQSYCFMFASVKSAETLERLKVIESSTDGFYISEQDLKIRGPGDFFGKRQSGLPAVKGFSSDIDMGMLNSAVEAVSKLEKKELPVTENERAIVKFMVKREFLNKETRNILN